VQNPPPTSDPLRQYCYGPATRLARHPGTIGPLAAGPVRRYTSSIFGDRPSSTSELLIYLFLNGSQMSGFQLGRASRMANLLNHDLQYGEWSFPKPPSSSSPGVDSQPSDPSSGPSTPTRKRPRGRPATAVALWDLPRMQRRLVRLYCYTASKPLMSTERIGKLLAALAQLELGPES
jgi:hypothetical protein